MIREKAQQRRCSLYREIFFAASASLAVALIAYVFRWFRFTNFDAIIICGVLLFCLIRFPLINKMQRGWSVVILTATAIVACSMWWSVTQAILLTALALAILHAQLLRRGWVGFVAEIAIGSTAAGVATVSFLTGSSLPLVVWLFLLIMASHTLIPKRAGARARHERTSQDFKPSDSRFDRSYSTARQLLQAR